MVDSFTKWARRNRDRAKDLDDFIHEGLVAAAKRCESCLKDDLGLTFAEEQLAATQTAEVENVPSGYEADSTASEPEPSFEVTPEDMSPGTSEVPIESESEAVSIDSVGRIEEEEMDDISIDGPPREFTTDFELVEPTDLDVESTEESDEVEEEKASEPESEETESSDEDKKPSFTWADYEKAVAPSPEELDVEEDEEEAELPPPIELESTITPETESQPEPEHKPEPEVVEVPEPPPMPPDDFESSSIDEDISDETESFEPITEPPAPPPPPESDEDEEERRRRARRLFFGE
jgi:hypothetical protein